VSAPIIHVDSDTMICEDSSPCMPVALSQHLDPVTFRVHARHCTQLVNGVLPRKRAARAAATDDSDDTWEGSTCFSATKSCHGYLLKEETWPC
jgi:hypothetical protein